MTFTEWVLFSASLVVLLVSGFSITLNSSSNEPRFQENTKVENVFGQVGVVRHCHYGLCTILRPDGTTQEWMEREIKGEIEDE